MSTVNNYFVTVHGAIPNESVADYFGTSTGAGARAFFVGTVRPDEIDGQITRAIDYSMHETMARDAVQNIGITLVKKYDLLWLKVAHSIGHVGVGENSLLVVVESMRRNAAFRAMEECVNLVKREAPIWGKEMFDGVDSRWKTNG